MLFGGAIWANGQQRAARKLKQKNLTDQAHAFQRSVFIIILDHFTCFKKSRIYYNYIDNIQ
jgi:hypothetical protein